jgi:glycosyltransferase involved in cell wall biosynthesis
LTTPEISVVVATCNRANLLARLVTALERQRGAPRFEVVVVDDGSTDDTPAVLDRLASDTLLDFRSIRIDRNGGVAAARNVGWRSTQGALVAFTDDDCEPQPEWLAALAGALRSADLVQGQTTPNPTQANEGWFAWAPDVRSELGFYETCNMGYRRDVLEAVRGFDEVFRPLRGARRGRGRYRAPIWGEDADLAWRAKAAGKRSAFAADAMVCHDVKPGRLRDRLSLARRQAGLVVVVARHPEVRTAFESRWFVKRAHGLAAAAAASAVIAGRSRRPAWWVVTATVLGLWVNERRRDYPKSAWPRVLPQWFLIDLADTAVLASASVRHRTFLL